MSYDAIRRALRTLLQVSVAGAVIAALQGFGVTHWTAEQVVLVMGVATPLITAGQNLLEDGAGLPPAFGK